MDEKRYLEHRKTNLKTYLRLMKSREKMTKRIGQLRKDLKAWDNALLEE